MEIPNASPDPQNDLSEKFVDHYLKKQKETLLSRRLAFFLRYGAAEAGLEIVEGGYVNLESLMKVAKGFHYYTETEVLNEVASSTSHKGTKRFELKFEKGVNWIRACYGRKLVRNPCHEGCSVKRLLYRTVEYVAQHIDNYDFEYFPDVLIGEILDYMKQHKRLNSTALRRLLVPSLHRLDLRNVLVTESVLRLVARQCPALRLLDLRGAGYALTDHSFTALIKKLPDLEHLYISDATHLTDRAVELIPKRLHKLKSLHMSQVKNASEAVIITLATSLSRLKTLDIYLNPNISLQGRDTLFELGTRRNIEISLRDLNF